MNFYCIGEIKEIFCPGPCLNQCEDCKKLETKQSSPATEGEVSELRIGEDNICPVTEEPCDDECCPPGSICNLSGNWNEFVKPDKPEEGEVANVLNEDELQEECKRLAQIAEFWQNKYYEVMPPHQPIKLDNL